MSLFQHFLIKLIYLFIQQFMSYTFHYMPYWSMIQKATSYFSLIVMFYKNLQYYNLLIIWIKFSTSTLFFNSAKINQISFFSLINEAKNYLKKTTTCIDNTVNIQNKVDQRNGITGVAFQNGKSSMLKINILQILKKMSMPRKQKETSNIWKNLKKNKTIFYFIKLSYSF